MMDWKLLETHFRVMGRDDIPPCGLASRRRNQDGRMLLGRLMRDMGFHLGAEIGTFYGDSAKLWCESIPGLKLTCIDPYNVYRPRKSQEKQDATYEAAKAKLAAFDVTFLRESSLTAHAQIPDESLDFVYIDGDHAFDMVMQDIIFYVPKVRKGGLILVHDYLSFYLGGVVHAINAYTACHLISPWFVTRDVLPTAFWQKGDERA